MSLYKKGIIILIFAAIACIYFINIFLDFSRLVNFTLYNSFSNEVIKRINVLLAASLIWLAGKNSFNRRDTALMKIVFVIIGFGEICFLAQMPVLGIVFFALCQCLLIKRHGQGLIPKLLKTTLRKRLLLSLLALFLLIIYCSVIVQLYPYIALNSIVLSGGIYGILISFSLWTGLACHILTLRPNKNSRLIASGMLCFFFCDILVGLDGLLSYSTAWIIATSFIWVFYTPAITLLALSCYRFEGRPYSSATIANI